MQYKLYIKKALPILIEAGVEEPALDARLLFQDAFSLSLNDFMLCMEDECTNETGAELFDSYIRRRAEGEPVAYILGHKSFWGQDYLVSPAVLVPRPDTETLVDAALSRMEKMPLEKVPRLLDLCTGSGCVGISISLETGLGVDESDISAEALQVARQNADRLGARIHFYESDLFEGLVNRIYDLITVNPPYISHEAYQKLGKEVHHEPVSALDDGGDGLSFYRRLAKEALPHLSDGGLLLTEIGYDQAQKVCEIFNREPWLFVELKKDFGGNDRVLVFRKG